MDAKRTEHIIQALKRLEDQLNCLKDYVGKQTVRPTRARTSSAHSATENPSAKAPSWVMEVMEALSGMSDNLDSLKSQISPPVDNSLASLERRSPTSPVLRAAQGNVTLACVQSMQDTASGGALGESNSFNELAPVELMVSANLATTSADPAAPSTDPATPSTDPASSTDPPTSLADSAPLSAASSTVSSDVAASDVFSPATSIETLISVDTDTSRPSTEGRRINTDASFEIAPTREFSLSPAESGENFIPALSRIIQSSGFSNILSVPQSDLDLVSLQNKIELHDADCTSNLYEAYRGYLHTFVSKRTKFKWPDLSRLSNRPSDKEVERFLEDFICHPPEDPVSYYCGGGSFPFDFQLHPGHTLLNCSDLVVANAEYFHIGDKGSGTGFHCEDADFWSCNSPEIGYKAFIIIRESHTARFEQFIRETWRGGDCDQFVRHNNLLIAPSTLRKQGINFDIVCAGPGDMIVTRPRQYHAVVNISACFARSINFLLPDDPLLPKDLAVCKDCGLYRMASRDNVRVVAGLYEKPPVEKPKTGRTKNGKKRKATEDPPTEEPKISRLTSIKTTRIKEHFQTLDRLCYIPELDSGNAPSLEVLNLVIAIHSLPATLQFASLVRAWRDRGADLTINANSQDMERLKQQAKVLKDADEKSDLHRYRRMLCQVAIARQLEQGRPSYFRKAPPGSIDSLAEDLDWDKNKLRWHASEGKGWVRALGPYTGFLPFIFFNKYNPFNVTRRDYLSIDDKQLPIFHSMLKNEYASKICAAGVVLEKIIMHNSPEVFIWEDGRVDFATLDPIQRGEIACKVQVAAL